MTCTIKLIWAFFFIDKEERDQASCHGGTAIPPRGQWGEERAVRGLAPTPVLSSPLALAPIMTVFFLTMGAQGSDQLTEHDCLEKVT